MSARLPSLLHRVSNAGQWVIGANLLGQAMRFGSNLVLTRLLYPEAFGLMTIVTALWVGVSLIMDAGIRNAVIVHPTGASPDYLDTAWTLQIGRGMLVALVMLAMAGPLAVHYNQPDLTRLVPVVALQAAVDGFISTKKFLAERDLKIALVLRVEMPLQLFTLLSTIGFAWLLRDPMGLALGNLTAAVVGVVASHLVFPGRRNRIAWHREHAGRLLRFASLAIPGSILAFMLGDGTKMLAASMLDIRLFGLMGTAAALVTTAVQICDQVASRVFVPAYAEIVRSSNRERLPAAVRKARIPQILGVGAFSVVFAFAGDLVFRILYDPRYADGGTIMRILALGTIVNVLSSSYYGILLALDKVRLHVLLVLAQVSITWAAIFVGHALLGAEGVFIGLACAGWLMYPITAMTFKRYGLWFPSIDLPVLAGGSLLALLSYLLGDWSALQRW